MITVEVTVTVTMIIDDATKGIPAMTKAKTYVRKALRQYSKTIGHPYVWEAQPTRATIK